MGKLLTDKQIRHYDEQGYCFPFRALSSSEALETRRKIEDFEKLQGDEAQKFLSFKAHLPFKFLTDLVKNPLILDAIEDVIGPNILCWGSSFFQKNAHDPRFISWHQDSYYYGMEPTNTVTAWLAISRSDVTAGSVRVIPGSHRQHAAFVNTPSNIICCRAAKPSRMSMSGKRST